MPSPLVSRAGNPSAANPRRASCISVPRRFFVEEPVGRRRGRLFCSRSAFSGAALVGGLAGYDADRGEFDPASTFIRLNTFA
jgi:hypothetical protein